MREAADPAVSARRLREIEMGEGVRFRRAGTDAEVVEKMPADEVGRPAEGIADSDVHAWLAIVDGEELRVAVGEVKQADVAQGRYGVRVDRFSRCGPPPGKYDAGRSRENEKAKEFSTAQSHDVGCASVECSLGRLHSPIRAAAPMTACAPAPGATRANAVARSTRSPRVPIRNRGAGRVGTLDGGKVTGDAKGNPT